MTSPAQPFLAPPMTTQVPPVKSTSTAPKVPTGVPTAGTSPGFIPSPTVIKAPTFDLDQATKNDEPFVSAVPKSTVPTDVTKTPSMIPKTPVDMPEASEWKVTKNQTVAGQFASIMDSDNPVFKIVQESVMRQHAAAGGKNSLMAARSASMAVADVGFKIASQDAATFARSAEFNAAMKNQFGLAEQQFMHNSMLSEQNFKQGVLMLREQHAATLDQINADLQSRKQLMGLEANINLKLEATRQGYVLDQIDKNFRNNLDTMQAQFEYNWETAEQSQEQALERMDRETSNDMYKGAQQQAWQQQLNYMSEMAQNSRMLLSAMGDIGSNPNITAAQASSAMADVLRQYNAVNEQLAAVYAAPKQSPATIATNYLDFSTHNIGYGTNTGGTVPKTPFYGGTPAGTPNPPAAPKPAAPKPPVAPPPVAPKPPAAAPLDPAAAYLAANPDVAANPYFAQNPLEHYNKYGKTEGRTWGTSPTGPTQPVAPGTAPPVPVPTSGGTPQGAPGAYNGASRNDGAIWWADKQQWIMP